MFEELVVAVPGTEGGGAHAHVPDDGGEELCREDVDCPVGRGDGQLPQHGQAHQPGGLDISHEEE